MGLAPLPKAATASHREENLGVLDFDLEDEDMSRISGLEERYAPMGGLTF